MNQRQGFTGGNDGRTKFGHPTNSILQNPDVQGATNVVVLIEGSDGKPQIWANGDQQRAADLYQRGAALMGLKEPA